MFSKVRKGLQDVVGVVAVNSKLLREYQQQELICQEGPHKLWKVYSGTSKKASNNGQKVCIWILDKRLTQKGMVSNRTWENFIEQQKRACNNLIKLKHPGVLRVLEPMEDNRSHLIIITEEIIGSLGSLVPCEQNQLNSDKQQDLPLSSLEIKHGLMNLINTISFLHREAKMQHGDIQPGSVFVTKGGDWKLGGLTYLKPLGGNSQFLFYPEVGNSFGSNGVILDKPLLNYAAPELIATNQNYQTPGGDVQVSDKVDVFSVGALMFRVFEKRNLLEVGNTAEYMSKLPGIQSTHFQHAPMQIQGQIRQMVSTIPAQRPGMQDFSGHAFFSTDVLLRALVFMEAIVQADLPTKAAFFKDLNNLWKQFHQRIVVNKVLPVVVEEVSTLQLQLIVVPLLMAIIPSLTQTIFMEQCLPQLAGIMLSSQGAVLLEFVKGISEMSQRMTVEAKEAILIPLLQVCWQTTDGVAHEEALKQFQVLQDDIGYQVIKSGVMPHLHEVCQRTDRARVRTKCFKIIKQLIPRTDKDEALKVINTIKLITKADKTPGTMQQVAEIAEAISKQWGAEIVANDLLPVIIPLLLSGTMTKDQLTSVLNTVKQLLTLVEEKAMALTTQTQSSVENKNQMVDWQQTAVPQGVTWTSNASASTSGQNQQKSTQKLPQDIFSDLSPTKLNNEDLSGLFVQPPQQNVIADGVDLFKGLSTNTANVASPSPPTAADQYANMLSDTEDLFKLTNDELSTLEYQHRQQQQQQPMPQQAQQQTGEAAGTLFQGLNVQPNQSSNVKYQRDPIKQMFFTQDAMSVPKTTWQQQSFQLFNNNNKSSTVEVELSTLRSNISSNQQDQQLMSGTSFSNLTQNQNQDVLHYDYMNQNATAQTQQPNSQSSFDPFLQFAMEGTKSTQSGTTNKDSLI